VDRRPIRRSIPPIDPRGAWGCAREVPRMSMSDWLDFVRLNWKKEEGQTMAEYGVVLAVITIGAVAVFTALSGGISASIGKVTALLP